MSETFIPNSFQVPNDYCDIFMAYLTSDEYKVLMYAARRIFGFQKRQDRIALSQFSEGITLRNGRILDEGTGLTLGSVRKAVNGLVQSGLLVKEEEAKPDRTPALYSLQLDADKVKLAELKARRDKRKATNRRRIKKARASRKEPVTNADIAAAINTDEYHECQEEQLCSAEPFEEEGNRYAPQEPYGYAPQTVTGTHDNTHNIQGKKVENHNSDEAEKSGGEAGNEEPFDVVVFLATLKGNQRLILENLFAIHLDGYLSLPTTNYFMEAFTKYGRDKTLQYLWWSKQQGHSWQHAYNIAKKTNMVQNFETVEVSVRKPCKVRLLNSDGTPGEVVDSDEQAGAYEPALNMAFYLEQLGGSAGSNEPPEPQYRYRDEKPLEIWTPENHVEPEQMYKDNLAREAALAAERQKVPGKKKKKAEVII
jgi:hypothetical protein